MELSIIGRFGLHGKIDRITAILNGLECGIDELLLTGARGVDVAEIKGRVSMLPMWWMLMVTLLSTWLAGAGIVFTLVKASHP